MPYLTPETIPGDVICRRLRIPNNIDILGAVTGALAELTKLRNWEQFGAITPAQISEAMTEMLAEFTGDNACMLGTIMSFIGNALPSHLLICNGTIYQRVDYPDLYALYVGVAGGALIVNADQFRVPDLVSRTIVGAGASFPLFTIGGVATVALTTAQIPAHTHTYTPAVFNVDLEGAGAPDPFAAGVGAVANTGSTGGGAAHQNMPPYAALDWVVVAR